MRDHYRVATEKDGLPGIDPYCCWVIGPAGFQVPVQFGSGLRPLLIRMNQMHEHIRHWNECTRYGASITPATLRQLEAELREFGVVP